MARAETATRTDQFADFVNVGPVTDHVQEGPVRATDFVRMQLVTPSTTDIGMARLPQKEQKANRIVQYELAFVQDKYASLARRRGEPKYAAQKEMLDGAMTFDLHTALGERFNAGLSQRRMDVINGEICDTHSKEPMLAMIERGREYRATHGSNSEDQKRESAEVTGFAYAQNVLAHEGTGVGTIVLSISPPGGDGSMYKHNFYDVFTLKQDEKGKYVDARRYSSGLEIPEYKSLLHFDDNIETDIDLLSKPFVLEPKLGESYSADDIHAYLHKEHSYMPQDVYEDIIAVCNPYIEKFLEGLANDPGNTKLHQDRYAAILNLADAVAFGTISMEKKQTLLQGHIEQADYDEDIKKQVREVKAACGSSGDLRDSASPFSASDFDPGNPLADGFETSIECPTCQKPNAKKNGEALVACKHCGSDAIDC